jgi:hypothetical protein
MAEKESEIFMKITDYPTIYYGGFDPGSGKATLALADGEGIELPKSNATIASVIADGTIGPLLGRGDIDSKLADVLRKNEYTVTLSNGSTFFLADLVREGKNATDALGHQGRYWGDHSRLLLMCLAALLTPEQDIELRLVTALPVSLYSKENRRKVKQALEGFHRYSFGTKGREQTRDLVVKVGYVGMEGQGILVHAGAETGDQVVLDIGHRTTDIVVADGQVLTTKACKGNHEIGVGLIYDDVRQFIKSHGRNPNNALLEEVMYAYAHGKSFPKSLKGDRGEELEPGVREVIERSIKRVGKSLQTFLSATLNSEGMNAGADYDTLFLAGGGAYYFEEIIKALIPRVELVSDAELANAAGYLDLACSLESARPTIWENND